MAAALEAKISRLRLDAPRKNEPQTPAAPRPYTAASVEQYREACLCLRRVGLPAHVLRGALAPFCLLRRTPRAPHPTRRRGHPLPPLVQALYRAHPSFRRALADALTTSGRVPSGLRGVDNAEPPCSRKATQGLLKLFEAMDADCATKDPDASFVRQRTALCCQQLAETARAAGTTLNIDSPADWFRLAHVVLSCLPATVVRRSFVGICGRFDRYTFPECGHALHEDDGADSASVSGLFRSPTLRRWRHRDAAPPRRRRRGRMRVYAFRGGAAAVSRRRRHDHERVHASRGSSIATVSQYRRPPSTRPLLHMSWTSPCG